MPHLVEGQHDDLVGFPQLLTLLCQALVLQRGSYASSTRLTGGQLGFCTLCSH